MFGFNRSKQKVKKAMKAYKKLNKNMAKLEKQQEKLLSAVKQKQK
jgi:hypothetical protein